MWKLFLEVLFDYFTLNFNDSGRSFFVLFCFFLNFGLWKLLDTVCVYKCFLGVLHYFRNWVFGTKKCVGTVVIKIYKGV